MFPNNTIYEIDDISIPLPTSNGEKIQLSSLTEMDEIRVVGVDKEILSVAIYNHYKMHHIHFE